MKKTRISIFVYVLSSVLLGQTYHPNTPNPPTATESLIDIGDNATLVATGNATWFSNVYYTDETDIIPPWNNVWETVFGQSSADQIGRYFFGGGDLLSVDESMGIPEKFMVNNAYPNPFNPSTTIKYAIPDAETHGNVNIRIFNIMGRLVCELVDEQKIAGWHSVIWNGKNNFGTHSSTGMYLVQIRAGNDAKFIKIMLIR